jgi:hypothetical protein
VSTDLSTFVIRSHGPEDLFDRPAFDWQHPPVALAAGTTRAVAQLEARGGNEPPYWQQARFFERLARGKFDLLSFLPAESP